MCEKGNWGWGGALTPLVEILVPRVGRLMPFLCALKFWLWLVWFFDLAMSACSRREWAKERGGGSRGEMTYLLVRKKNSGHDLSLCYPSQGVASRRLTSCRALTPERTTGCCLPLALQSEPPFLCVCHRKRMEQMPTPFPLLSILSSVPQCRQSSQ